MGQYDDLGAVESPPQADYSDLGAIPSESAKDPDMSAVKKVFQKHLDEDSKKRTPEGQATPAQSWSDDVAAGWQMSATGLMYRGRMPDKVLPEDASRAAKILFSIGQVGSDIPLMGVSRVAGTLAGTAAAAPISGPAAPFVGAITGQAAAFAVPAGIRQALVDHYRKGDITDAQDFVDRASSVLTQMLKQGTIGALTAGAGLGVGAALSTPAEVAAGATGMMVNPMVKMGAMTASQLATMTTAGAAVEGHLPNRDDFFNTAVLLGAFHVAGLAAKPFSEAITTHVQGKLMEAYAKTGLRPEAVHDMAESDPVLKQQLLSEDPAVPEALGRAVDPGSDLGPPPIKIKSEGSEGEQLKVEPLPKEKSEGEEIPHVRSEAVNSILKTIGDQPDAPKQKLTFDEIYRMGMDKMDPFKVMTKALRGESALGLKEDPYALARAIQSSSRKADLMIEKGPYTFGAGEADPERTGTPGLSQIWDKIDDGKEFTAYAKAKHAIDLEGRGINSGVKIEDAEAVVKELGPKYEKLAKQNTQFRNDVLKYYSDSGMMSQDAYNGLASKWENYSDMHRVLGVDEESGGKSNGGSLQPSQIIKSIEGSSRQTIDPRISDIKATHSLVKMAEKNRVMTAMAEMVKAANKDGDFRFGKVAETDLGPEHDANVKMLQGEGYSEKEAQAAALMRDARQPTPDDQIVYFENGTKKTISDVPKGLIEAVKDLDAPQVGLVLKALAGPSRTLRAGMLSSPMFAIRHFIRQEATNTALSEHLYTPIVDVAKGLSGMMGESSPEFDEWIMRGGAISSVANLDANYIKSKIADLEKDTGAFSNGWNSTKNGLQIFKHAIELTDEARVFQKYRNAKDAGLDPWQAAFSARDTSIDVSRSGSAIRPYSMVEPFQTIKMQGLDLVARRMQADPVGTSAKLMATITVPSAMLWYINHDKEWYKNGTDRDRDLNYRIAVGDPDDPNNPGHIIRIPRPFEPGIVFGALAERLLDAFFTDNHKAFKNFKDSVSESVIPGYIPTIAEPIIQQFANKSLLTDSPLIPKHLEEVLPQYQSTPYTSDTAKMVAAALRVVPHFATTPGSLGSPIIVDSYLNNWLGGAGQLALAAANKALEKSGVADAFGVDYVHNRPPNDWSDNPFFKSFVERYPTASNKQINDFYDRFTSSQNRLNTLKLLAKEGKVSDWQRQMSEGMENDQLINLSKAKSGISQAIKMAQDVYKSDDIPRDQKRQLMDGFYSFATATATQYNQVLDQMDKALSLVEKNKGPQ